MAQAMGASYFFKVALNNIPNSVTIEVIRDGERIVVEGNNNEKEMFDDLGI